MERHTYELLSARLFLFFKYSTFKMNSQTAQFISTQKDCVHVRTVLLNEDYTNNTNFPQGNTIDTEMNSESFKYVVTCKD